eukprot:EC799947.1.p1 GENE.EC799947.1~~EC799947.1.p1  ORF type:complete len:227 (+),score=41.22 EC799947.1:45-725(+)
MGSGASQGAGYGGGVGSMHPHPAHDLLHRFPATPPPMRGSTPPPPQQQQQQQSLSHSSQAGMSFPSPPPPPPPPDAPYYDGGGVVGDVYGTDMDDGHGGGGQGMMQSVGNAYGDPYAAQQGYQGYDRGPASPMPQDEIRANTGELMRLEQENEALTAEVTVLRESTSQIASIYNSSYQALASQRASLLSRQAASATAHAAMVAPGSTPLMSPRSRITHGNGYWGEG